MKRLMVLFAGLMAILMSISAASAITVDGNKTSGEWDENWAFGQTNNATAASEYDINNLGDRLEIMQGTLQADTGDYNAVDPKNDSGSSYAESMALNGNSSGSDLYKVYGHYNQSTDTLYGMTEVYGIPGDHDGNGDVTTESSAGDSGGDVGPAGFGLSTQESWSIAFYQVKNGDYQDYSLIQISDNDWNIIDTDVGLDYDNVSAKFSYQNFRQIGDDTLPKSVYEIKVENFSKFYDVNPGSKLAIQVGAGSNGDPQVGEDSGVVFFEIPNPQIDIEKFTKDMGGDWQQADNSADPDVPFFNSAGQTVEWKYEVTNNGTVPFDLANVTVTDDKGVTPVLDETSDDGNDDILSPGETWTYTASGTVEECPEGSVYTYENIGTVNAISPFGEVNDTDPSHYKCQEPTPGIDIEKYTNGENADTGPGPKVSNESTVTWTYEVHNNGSDDLQNVQVTDDKLGTLPETAIVDKGDGDDILNIGETWVYEMTGTADCNFTEDNPYENTATTNGTGVITGESVEDTDPSHYYCKPPNGVPALTPTSLMGLIGALGLIGIVGLKRRD
ncbi:hypothetical protein Metev_1565 [Methanohalobium evestigatum Z-7303]|uniref:DUF7507 domain-containing protein n=1 Tax=Methanohalobium evestigatum (strain ATCC BAA-1072 / DSM 3721 / NBRC 107634 / OCM 161 / Z-7303) TaxID=644295 RepID=D7E9Z0_METEZ|nr:VPXXXP-CTERM sorting domain-containing protein [Methanohalobium evestigatum]ADI74412.1 hypothetical protein Metev_1565 [Methanohalobium evestigatum Z-7303]